MVKVLRKFKKQDKRLEKESRKREKLEKKEKEKRKRARERETTSAPCWKVKEPHGDSDSQEDRDGSGPMKLSKWATGTMGEDSDSDEEMRDSRSGKRIKLHRDTTVQDKADEARRLAVLETLNGGESVLPQAHPKAKALTLTLTLTHRHAPKSRLWPSTGSSVSQIQQRCWK